MNTENALLIQIYSSDFYLDILSVMISPHLGELKSVNIEMSFVIGSILMETV